MNTFPALRSNARRLPTELMCCKLFINFCIHDDTVSLAVER